MLDKKINYRIVNIAFIFAILYFLSNSISLWVDVIGKCISVLAPFIVGFAFAYAFTPLVSFLERKGINKTFAIILVIFGIVLFIGLLLYFTLPVIYDQLSLFIKMSVKILNNLSSNYDITLGGYSVKIMDYLNDLLKSVANIISDTSVNFINNSIGFISKAIVGVVGFIYFLIYMDKIRDYIKRLLMSYNKKHFEYFKMMDSEITNYIKGLEIFMLIQLVEYSFLFFIIGHPNWLILGIIACITTVIPYFGGLITNILAIFLAWVVSPKLVVLTIIICLIFPQLDGYFISPRIYGKTNKVNPLITIMAVSVGGRLAGVYGIIVALPCYLLLRITYRFYMNDLKRSMGIGLKKTEK